MTRIVDVTHTQLLERRRRILETRRTTLAEMHRRAASFELTGEEWADWDDLQEIGFLLGEHDPAA
ncbi:hypothetical protein [Actinokineospora sp. NBRC 105648]|uniref:hypothetical protein n=1 Tax=Actinokineospora sp. NBRC 105648 TaxID=3032206 RepID=UPI0024A01338|nr:hypothetical protein [Actinokineospora sp. NBRC 105648]GLZ39934.1 hypothetical protein Acsp05_35580 [Actinokineospora sp. NBRC 105648]